MTTTVAIVGLGQIGASIGLALKANGASERILGVTRNRSAARTAETLGAVDAVVPLRSAAKEAQVVFLCLPLGEMHEVVELIAPALKENVVVLDTAPIKGNVLQWMGELLPEGRYYIGLVPTVNADLLDSPEHGTGGARADLFHRTVMMVIPPRGTPAAVEQLAMNVARLLGAKPMLTDAVEADGIMTTAHLLPQIAAAAVVEASMAPGGWVEARKMAGRPFSSVTGGIADYDDPDSLREAVMSNPQRVVHGLDVLIAALTGLRDDIANASAARLGEKLLQSLRGRQEWLEGRTSASWLAEGHEPVKLPGLGQQITQMFFGGRIAEATSDLAEKLEGKK